jgi:hypothetical protein
MGPVIKGLNKANSFWDISPKAMFENLTRLEALSIHKTILPDFYADKKDSATLFLYR